MTHLGGARLGAFADESFADKYVACMWIDERGVAHTVTLPDPTELMSGTFRRAFDALISVNRVVVAALLERVEEQIYEQEIWSLPVDLTFEQMSPPVGVLNGEVWAEGQLEAVLAEVDFRWKLDAVIGLVDYVDSLDRTEGR